jgi:hypothetical protein
MKLFLSWRPFALVLSAVCALAVANPAQAVERRHVSHGTAHFVNANDFVGAGTASHLGLYDEVGHAEFSPTPDPTRLPGRCLGDLYRRQRRSALRDHSAAI